MKNRRKEERGSTVLVTPLIWTISILIFLFFLVTALRVIEPFVVYQKISETSLKYIFIMEEYGYLAAKDKENLLRELQQKGLDVSKVRINADERRREYGEVIGLEIHYRYSFRHMRFQRSALTPEYETEDIAMCVSKKGVSKR
ncbi:MAG: hypothetical protein J6M02_05325 [Clostridia bacterium]|nr:hypothetical protein [Clostridia bacterium]